MNSLPSTAPRTNAGLELVCPAGTLSALKVAVEAGADTVYCGFNDRTNARNFPGLNLNIEEMREGISFAHGHGVKVIVAINTFPQAGQADIWRSAVDRAASLRADAVVIADLGLLAYAAEAHPNLRRHLSVQASACTAVAINFLADRYGVKRVVLPRVLTVSEIAAINAKTSVETEVFVFGGLCVMAEGKCSLSSYVAGQSPNMNGVCSPACAVRYEKQGDKMLSRLADYTIDIVDANEPAGYPTICKGQFLVRGEPQHLFEEPTSLNAMGILDALERAGVRALKVEGRQRGKAYIRDVVKGFRQAIDRLGRNQADVGGNNLRHLSEGARETSGSYQRVWR
jgi:collagenase-like PrtC family protease